jgi:hypothetical protein
MFGSGKKLEQAIYKGFGFNTGLRNRPYVCMISNFPLLFSFASRKHEGYTYIDVRIFTRCTC